MRTVVGIDLGTQSLKVVFYDFEQREIAATASAALDLYQNDQGAAEQQGETVKITDGPFKDFVGDIKEVNEEKKKLKVIVKIFGRGTEVELNYMQVEKQS